MGWASKRNGELLALAVSHFDMFLTADRNLSYQQDVSTFDIGVGCLRRAAIGSTIYVRWCLVFSKSSERQNDVL
jgi:hypothetical protein